MGMDCKRCEQQIWAYAEGQLAPVQVHALEAHLRECSHCQRQLEAARVAYRALRRLRAVGRCGFVGACVARSQRCLSAPRSAGRVFGVASRSRPHSHRWQWWLGGAGTRNSSHPSQTPAPMWTPPRRLVELHEQLELADWSPSPTPSYFISTGYTHESRLSADCTVVGGGLGAGAPNSVAATRPAGGRDARYRRRARRGDAHWTHNTPYRGAILASRCAPSGLKCWLRLSDAVRCCSTTQNAGWSSAPTQKRLTKCLDYLYRVPSCSSTDAGSQRGGAGRDAT